MWRTLVPTLADFIFLACFSLIMLLGGRLLSGDGDAARHLVLGEHILQTGTFPETNMFSASTPDQPFAPHEWLAEVLSAGSARIAGLAGPVVLHGAVVGLAFWLLFRHVRSRGHGVGLSCAVTGLAIAASALHWLPRPHVFTFVGVAFFSWALSAWRRKAGPSWTLWLLAPAMALWVNLHGAFVLGFVLLGVALLQELIGLARAYFGSVSNDRLTAVTIAVRRCGTLASVIAASLAAACLNPDGASHIFSVRDYLSSGLVMSSTAEFASPNFHEWAPRPFLVMLLATIGALAYARRRPGLADTLLVVGMAAMALQSVRHAALFAILVAPVLADLLGQCASQVTEAWRAAELPRAAKRIISALPAWLVRRDAALTRSDARLGGGFWPMAIVVGVLITAHLDMRNGRAPWGIDFNPTLQPVQAVNMLKQLPLSGNGFNAQPWGGYLLYRSWPERGVFIDGELNRHSEPLLRDYLAVTKLQTNWQEVLDRRGIGWVLMPNDSLLVRRLLDSEEWLLVYHDQIASIFVRNEAPQ